MEILRNVALAPLTTLGIGGPARYFVDVRSAEDAREAVLWAREYGHPLFILGGGSNLVVSDEGWPGLVARMAIEGVERGPSKDETLYDAGAGTGWDELVERAVADGCAGVECLSGIPGTVGGTPVQNVGAYGQDVSATIRRVEALDLESLEFVSLENGDCGFCYRGSRFNRADRGRYMILRVTFALRPAGAPCLRYADLKAHFERALGTAFVGTRFARRCSRYGGAKPWWSRTRSRTRGVRVRSSKIRSSRARIMSKLSSAMRSKSRWLRAHSLTKPRVASQRSAPSNRKKNRCWGPRRACGFRASRPAMDG